MKTNNTDTRKSVKVKGKSVLNKSSPFIPHSVDIDLAPEVWGPHFWFVLHSFAIAYPIKPTETSKKKAYDFVHSFAWGIPDSNSARNFHRILEAYPVAPYLDSRESFMKWCHFIHNIVNRSIGKQTIDYIDSLKLYHQNYETPSTVSQLYKKNREKIIYGFTLGILGTGLYLLYKQEPVYK